MAIWPWIKEALDHRLANDPPQYEMVHECTQCRRGYFCPDRYTTPRCEPTAFIREKGWIDDNKFGCTPCMAQLAVDDENRIAWWQAHGLPKAESLGM